MNVQTNYCNNNLLILDVKQLNKIMKLYYFYTLKALWDGQGKIKMYYGLSRFKKQLLGKRSIGRRSLIGMLFVWTDCWRSYIMAEYFWFVLMPYILGNLRYWLFLMQKSLILLMRISPTPGRIKEILKSWRNFQFSLLKQALVYLKSPSILKCQVLNFYFILLS